jgi:ParB/RepB/Spo0J family partition protein
VGETVRVDRDREIRVGLSALGCRFADLRWASPEATRQMAASLRRFGQLTPVLVCEGPSGLELLDGFKRLRAAPRAGLEELRVWPRVLKPPIAKVAILTANAGDRLEELEEAWVIRSLYREDGWSQAEIAQHLGRHKSWVCRRLALAEQLSPDVEADLKVGLLSTTAAREIARLPRGNQTCVAQAVVDKGLSTRETVTLVRAVLAATPEDIPKVITGAVQRAKPEGGPGRARSPAEQLVVDAAAVTQISGRMQAILLERPFCTYEDPAASLIRSTLGELRPVLETLDQTIRRFAEESHHGHPPISRATQKPGRPTP